MTPIKKIGEIFDGPHATPQRLPRGEKYFLNISSLEGGQLDLTHSDFVSDEDFAQWTRRVTPRADDFLFSYETRLGDAALMPDGIQACLGRRMALIRPDQRRIDPRFLLYTWRSPAFREQLAVKSIHGATVDRIPLKELGNWTITLPDMATQQAIGEVLGALDDKIAANQRLIAAITDLTLTRYQQLSPRPGRQTLAEVTSIGGGATPSTKNPSLWDGDVAWATPTDVTGLPGDWITATERTISETGLKSISSPLYPRGSILMTSRATIGAFALTAMPMTVNQGFIVLNAVDASLQMWLYAQLRSRVTEFKAWANGATFLELSKSVFKKLPFHEASMEDMLAFSRTAQSLLLRSEQAQKENTTLTAVRDELLPQLMSGRITVKDAEKRVEEEV